MPSIRIAVEGCCHGELDKIYETLAYIEGRDNIHVDLLLICGDFQAVRNRSDLKAMAVPPKYQQMQTFYKYYSGEKKAPVLTIFIGGNHEASNYLQELPYGGWVAPNIYYLGYAGVVRFGGLRIAGLSGIFKGRDYLRGHYEHPPYNNDTKRSCYHIRNIDVFRLKQMKQPIDVFLSHDWPRGIYNYGDTNALLSRKKFFREEVEAGSLGSQPTEELLFRLKPDYWFAAHLHVKFAALVSHQCEDGSTKETKFLSLDKCLPRRQFLQVLDFERKDDSQTPLQLELDREWLCILRSTNHLLRLTNSSCYMPGPVPGSDERYDFSATQAELDALEADFGGVFKIPNNFEQTAKPHTNGPQTQRSVPDPQIFINPQTTLMCEMLGLTNPFAVFSGHQPFNSAPAGADAGAAGFVPDDGDTNDSLDVDDRDEGILDDSDYIDSTIDTSTSFIGNSTFNPDEISLEEDDDSCAAAAASAAESEPPAKRPSLSPLPGTSESESWYPPADSMESELKTSPDMPCSSMSNTNSDIVPEVGASERTAGPLRMKRRNVAMYSSPGGDSDSS